MARRLAQQRVLTAHGVGAGSGHSQSRHTCEVYDMSAMRSASVPHSSMPSGKSARCPSRALLTSRSSRLPPRSVSCRPCARAGGLPDQAVVSLTTSFHPVFRLGVVSARHACSRSKLCMCLKLSLECCIVA